MKTITSSELEDLLATMSPGAHILGFSALTQVKVVQKTRDGFKRPIPWLEVYKLSSVRPMVQTHYEDAVNRARAKEDLTADFIASNPRYERYRGQLVRYITTGTVALPCQFNASASKQQTSRPTYLVRDRKGLPLRVVAKSQLEPWLPLESAPNKQGLENPILWRTYGILNIVSLSYNGEKYRVRRNPKPQINPSVAPLVSKYVAKMKAKSPSATDQMVEYQSLESDHQDAK